MVLQRNKNINVFGTGTDGDRITVNFEGSTASATVKNGEWLAVLPQRAEGENLIMTVSCGKETITFTDIVMGEVWLAGGQSNMELELQNCKTGQSRLKNDVTPNVRFYYTPKIVKGTKDYEEKMTNTCWALALLCEDESLGEPCGGVKAYHAVGRRWAIFSLRS